MNNIIKKCILITILIAQPILIKSMSNKEKVLPQVQCTSQEDTLTYTCKIDNLTVIKALKKRYDYETHQPQYDESYSGFTDVNYIGDEDAKKIFIHIEGLTKMREELDNLVKQAELRRQEKAQKARECSERLLTHKAM